MPDLRKFIRHIWILPIRFYQRLLSPLLPPACRFQPTCSAYAAEAILKFGILAGSWLALRRVLRCHPWGPSGYDPVPEAFSFFRSEKKNSLHKQDRSRNFGE